MRTGNTTEAAISRRNGRSARLSAGGGATGVKGRVREVGIAPKLRMAFGFNW